jgi:hypothetical protein
MSDIKYENDALPDLEVLKLRKENLELKKQLEEAQKILEENGLGEVGPKQVSDEELICTKQIGLLKQLSDKGIPFANEDVKNLEILVKTLLAIRGKTIVIEDGKKKKKVAEPNIAELLKIVKE